MRTSGRIPDRNPQAISVRNNDRFCKRTFEKVSNAISCLPFTFISNDILGVIPAETLWGIRAEEKQVLWKIFGWTSQLGCSLWGFEKSVQDFKGLLIDFLRKSLGNQNPTVPMVELDFFFVEIVYSEPL